VVARNPREIYSDRGRGVEKFISKLRNSRTSGKINLSCIQCEMELDYITVSRLFLVLVATY